MIDDNFPDFCDNFNIVDNAMDMRTLVRWNGRDLRNKENLAEHTHLVVACTIELYDIFYKYAPGYFQIIDYRKLIKHAMLHDSLEMLRGDILSITKDNIPGLRQTVTDEENVFLGQQGICSGNNMETRIVELADLMACYKFIEYELRFPSNDYMRKVYISTKEKFVKSVTEFACKYNIEECLEPEFGITGKLVEHNFPLFVKGYQDDAGTDIILTEDVVFMPHGTTVFGLKVQITPKEGEMAFLCARTSAANKGLVVAMCPIDPNFNGEVTAIVHNVSNNIIEYKAGESFCQFCVVATEVIDDIPVKVKREGKRSSGKLGSTGNVR